MGLRLARSSSRIIPCGTTAASSGGPLEFPAEDKNAMLDAEAARLIAAIDPLAKGLSCAVLVRSNARILTVIDALRSAGLPATSEGRFFPCQDSDVTAALLALLSVVAHPDDSLSSGHVRMTPLGRAIGGRCARIPSFSADEDP